MSPDHTWLPSPAAALLAMLGAAGHAAAPARAVHPLYCPPPAARRRRRSAPRSCCIHFCSAHSFDPSVARCLSPPRSALPLSRRPAGPAPLQHSHRGGSARPPAAMARRAAHPWQRRLGGALLLLLLAAGAGAVRETKYYDSLGISPDADEKTIQKAYRRAAL